MGIALALVSVGPTLNPLPSAAASEGRVLRRAEALGNTPTSPESSNLRAGEPVGQTLALLAARAGGASPAQVSPTPEPNNGVRVIYAPDARGPLPPAVTVSNSSLPPTFAANTGPNSLLGPPAQTSGPAGPTPPNLAGAPGAVNATVASSGPGQPALNGVAAGGAGQQQAAAATGQQQVTAATANARGVPSLTAASTTGAPGSPTGPVLAATTGGTSSGGGISFAGRVIPNLPAGPNAQRIVSLAQSQVGNRYTWGGTSPSTGFDCSGLISWVFATAGFSVPRMLEDQLTTGRRIRLEELRPGDILFFENTYKSGLSHNGIYVGDGKIVHAVDESTGVASSVLGAAYWSERYVGAVRVAD